MVIYDLISILDLYIYIYIYLISIIYIYTNDWLKGNQFSTIVLIYTMLFGWQLSSICSLSALQSIMNFCHFLLVACGGNNNMLLDGICVGIAWKNSNNPQPNDIPNDIYTSSKLSTLQLMFKYSSAYSSVLMNLTITARKYGTVWYMMSDSSYNVAVVMVNSHSSYWPSIIVCNLTNQR